MYSRAYVDPVSSLLGLLRVLAAVVKVSWVDVVELSEMCVELSEMCVELSEMWWSGVDVVELSEMCVV